MTNVISPMLAYLILAVFGIFKPKISIFSLELGGAMSVVMDSLRYLLGHGVAGYLIVGTLVFCLIISLERCHYLFLKASFDSREVLIALKKMILEGNYSQALLLTNSQPGNPELMVAREGLLAIEHGREAFQAAVNSAILDVNQACEKRLSYLSLIASSATLLGLFGTILGLITTFQAIGDTDPTEKARLLGSGISQAMSSTAAGVITGVLAMVVYTICTSRADSIVGKSQKVGLDLGAWVEQSEKQTERGAA